jgi:cytochrome c553
MIADATAPRTPKHEFRRSPNPQPKRVTPPLQLKNIMRRYLGLCIDLDQTALWRDRAGSSAKPGVTCLTIKGGIKGRSMSLQTVLLTAAFAVAASAAAHAEDKDKTTVPKQELDAKIAYCKTCHGVSGQGFRGAFPMPRLAGQQPEYIEAQLQAFIDRRRTNPVMFNVAHALSPPMLTALTTHFKDLNPKPLGGAPKELVAAGKKIYDEGVPSAEVPSCASCHGPDAKGAELFPRLAGQLHDYIERKLTNWEKERGQDKTKPDNSAIMQPIAHSLTDAQIKAVAAYLSYLE